MASDKRSYIWVSKEEAEIIRDKFKELAEICGKGDFELIEQAVRIVKMAKEAIEDIEEREAEEKGQ